MKLTVASRSAFESRIDTAFSSERSIVCRYRDVFCFDQRAERDAAIKRCFLETSLREGPRIVPLGTYKDVVIHILDETSGMATGSLKAIDGCLATALCRVAGLERIVFESGGNTGSALTRYGQHAGLETFFFCPLDNIDLLDSSLFNSPKAHLLGVESRARVKEFATRFAQATGVRHVPEKSWRHAAAMFRGVFILEHLLTVRPYDWIAQTVSAAFGPIGIFEVLNTFRQELRGLPRFLGIQQEANCPLFKAWKAVPGEPAGGQEAGPLLTRIMYDASPQTYQTYEDFRQLLLLTQGDVLTVNGKEFAACIDAPAVGGSLPERLRSRGIPLSLRSGQILEKTGLIALAGTFKAIDVGTITAGSSVLCCLTSGVSAADGRARPEVTLASPGDVLAYAEAVAKGN